MAIDMGLIYDVWNALDHIVVIQSIERPYMVVLYRNIHVMMVTGEIGIMFHIDVIVFYVSLTILII